jgi:ABC-type multidrug transport system fused ATPase/permease subunit
LLLSQWSLNRLDRRYDSRSLFYHTMTLPFPFFSRYFVDDIAARLMQMHTLGVHQAQALQFPIFAARVLLYTMGLVLLSPAFFLIVVLVAFNLSAGLYSAARGKQAEAAHHIFHEKIAHVAYNGLHNIESIRLQGGEARYLDSLRRAQIAAYSQRFAAWSVLPAVLPALNLIVLIIFVAALVETGTVSMLPAIIGFCLALLMVQPAVTAGQAYFLVREFSHRLDKISDIRAVPSETPSLPATEADVLLENVTFSYGDTLVLEGIDLQLHAGQSTGVVGHSGSGKSTLVYLIAGLYAPQSGTMRVQRSRLALVDSQPVVLDASIAENISLFDAAITPAQIEQATRDAGLHDVIMQQPDGYSTVIDAREHPFSRGQLQCLELARALVREPSLLLLDEATGALDAITELEVLQNLGLRGCTRLIVSHRLSAVRDCQEIIVIDQGKIVERGTHHSLMTGGQVYQQLIAGGILK